MFSVCVCVCVLRLMNQEQSDGIREKLDCWPFCWGLGLRCDPEHHLSIKAHTNAHTPSFRFSLCCRKLTYCWFFIFNFLCFFPSIFFFPFFSTLPSCHHPSFFPHPHFLFPFLFFFPSFLSSFSLNSFFHLSLSSSWGWWQVMKCMMNSEWDAAEGHLHADQREQRRINNTSHDSSPIIIIIIIQIWYNEATITIWKYATVVCVCVYSKESINIPLSLYRSMSRAKNPWVFTNWIMGAV